MTASYNFQGVLSNPETIAVTTAGVDVATPDGTAPHRLIGIRVINIDTGAACRVRIYTNDGSTNTQVYTKLVPLDDSIFFDDPILFGEGYPVQKITADAQTNGDLIATAYYAISTPQAKTT